MKADRRRTAKQAIALLSAPEFCTDVEALCFTPGGGLTPEDALLDAKQEQERKGAAFKIKWSIEPPPAALLDRDPRRPEAAALLAGRWGLLRVFPWTIDADLKRGRRRIQRVIDRAEREAQNSRRAELAQWLHRCRFSDSEIAAAVWGRTKGLKRSKNLAKADRLFAAIDKAAGGLKTADDLKAANRKALARAADHEARAAAMVRQARNRHETLLTERRPLFDAPLQADPISTCITKILRLKFFPHGLPLPLPTTSIAEPLDLLLDELRGRLLEGSSA